MKIILEPRDHRLIREIAEKINLNPTDDQIEQAWLENHELRHQALGFGWSDGYVQGLLRAALVQVCRD